MLFGSFLTGSLRFLLAFFGLFALVLLLAKLGGELMPALVALAAQAQGSAGGALRRDVLLKQELQKAQTAAVADAMVGELDDARVAAVARGELGSDIVEEL